MFDTRSCINAGYAHWCVDLRRRQECYRRADDNCGERLSATARRNARRRTTPKTRHDLGNHACNEPCPRQPRHQHEPVNDDGVGHRVVERMEHVRRMTDQPFGQSYGRPGPLHDKENGQAYGEREQTGKRTDCSRQRAAPGICDCFPASSQGSALPGHAAHVGRASRCGDSYRPNANDAEYRRGYRFDYPNADYAAAHPGSAGMTGERHVVLGCPDRRSIIECNTPVAKCTHRQLSCASTSGLPGLVGYETLG
jgi:hypothetical protein